MANEQANANDAKEQPMPAKVEKPDNNAEDPEEKKIVLTVRLFNQDAKSLDVREYSKREEPLFREAFIGSLRLSDHRFSHQESSRSNSSLNSPVALPLVAANLEPKNFEVFQRRATDGAFLEVTQFEPEDNFMLYSIKPNFPLATLSNDLNPSDLELPAGLDRLTNWARELAKDSDGTPEGIARRLRDELRTRGGFRYMKRNAVLANQDKPHDVEEFLFSDKQKRGHCEYFADALTLMLRAVNIPAKCWRLQRW